MTFSLIFPDIGLYVHGYWLSTKCGHQPELDNKQLSLLSKPSSAHLNGQVLADLLLEKKTEWTECFPVNRHTIGWPPEPVRYLVSQAILGYLHTEDAWLERRGLGARKP